MNKILFNKLYLFMKKIFIFKSLIFFIWLHPLLFSVWAKEQLSVHSITQKEIEQKVGFARWFKKNFSLDTLKPNYLPIFSYWKQFIEDKNEDQYIVLPSQGLVMPLKNLSEMSEVYRDYISGKDWKLNDLMSKYWAINLPFFWETKLWEKWHKVIWGHSSYYKNKPWKYKNQFQKIIGLNKWDLIYVFQKNKNKEFDLIFYKVTKSYNLQSSEIELFGNNNKDLLTLFTCTPIWWNKWRYIVEAERVEK